MSRQCEEINKLSCFLETVHAISSEVLSRERQQTLFVILLAISISQEETYARLLCIVIPLKNFFFQFLFSMPLVLYNSCQVVILQCRHG